MSKGGLYAWVLRGLHHCQFRPFQRLILPVYTRQSPRRDRRLLRHREKGRGADYCTRIRNAAVSRAIETSARITDARHSRFGRELRIRNLPALFSHGSPRADGWITRKLFRSGRLVAFTLRRNVPHNSRLSFFVRPARVRVHARSRSPVHRSISHDRAPYVSPGGKHCSVKPRIHYVSPAPPP